MGPVLVSAATGVTVFFACHLAVWRAQPSDNPRVILLGFLAVLGLAVSLAAALYMVGFDAVALSAVVWINGFVVVLYFFVYAGIARSVSVTLLDRVGSSGRDHVPLWELVEEYAGSSRFEDRIELMRQSDLVRVAGGRVELTTRGQRLARVSKVLGRLLGDGLQG